MRLRNTAITIVGGAVLLALAGCASTPRAATGAAHQPHAVNVLVGGSFDRSGDGPDVGATYEYRKSDKLGFGAFADIAFANDVSTALGGAVYFHPADRWTVLGGPGVEFADGDADVFARIGGAYEFPVESLTVSPTAWIDLGSGVALFVGVGIGFKF